MEGPAPPEKEDRVIDRVVRSFSPLGKSLGASLDSLLVQGSQKATKWRESLGSRRTGSASVGVPLHSSSERADVKLVERTRNLSDMALNALIGFVAQSGCIRAG